MDISEISEIPSDEDVPFIPTLHTFAMNNIFTGSVGELRFRAVPEVVMLNAKEVDYEGSRIHVEYWHGPYCYEKSTMEGAETFILTETGRKEMILWLKGLIPENYCAPLDKPAGSG